MYKVHRSEAGALRAKISGMRMVMLPNGVQVPCLGLGTWRMGESPSSHASDVTAVRQALEFGYRLIDTAEMYGDGGAERVVGEALRGAVTARTVRREDVFLVTKVLPANASRKGVIAACERSLERLGVNYVDLYLLHWRGSHPLEETVAAFEILRERGRIHAWGVSNFDVADLDDLWLLNNGPLCVANQVYYSASERGIEFDLLPAHAPALGGHDGVLPDRPGRAGLGPGFRGDRQPARQSALRRPHLHGSCVSRT